MSRTLTFSHPRLAKLLLSLSELAAFPSEILCLLMDFLPTSFETFHCDVNTGEIYQLCRTGAPIEDTTEKEMKKVNYHLLFRIPFCYYAAVVKDNCIYVTGGCSPDNTKPLNVVNKYDMRTGASWEWKKLANMKEARRGHVAVVCGDLIYVCGGGGWKGSKSCEVYDEKLDKWKKIPDMHFKRIQHAAVEYKGKIYCFGGSDNNDNSVEMFNPVTRRWATRKNIPYTLYSPSAVVIAGIETDYIAVVGDTCQKKGTDLIWLYAPEKNSWSVAEWKIPDARVKFSAHIMGYDLLIAGGFDNYGNKLKISNSLLLDLTSSTWFHLDLFLNK